MRRNYLGDRGENENDIQQSENELNGGTEIIDQENEDNEQEEINDGDEPPPLEDMDESESEQENEIIEPVKDNVEVEKAKEDDVGRI